MSYFRTISLTLLTCISAATYSQVSSLAGARPPGATDDLAVLRSIRLNGFAAGDHFATSAAIAGDLNGDGYADVIVGAPLNDAAGANAGRAYLFFGGPGMNTTPDLILTGLAAGDGFGACVAGAGDVNADGFADVIVGAPNSDVVGVDAGQAYVFFGGPAMDANHDFVLTGEAAGDQFGTSVASAGDFNGDGYDDVVVGSPQADATGSNNGKGYLFYGGVFPEGTVDRIFTGSSPGDLLGVSVACAGDMDGDGYDDVIIGAEGATGGSPISGPMAGRATIYFGDSGGMLHRLINLSGSAPYDYFGHSVAGAGDVNGDGYADAIVGAYGNDVAGSSSGRASLYFGGSYVDLVADLQINGTTAGEATGFSVASIGDPDGDGYCDVIVGALLSSQGASNAGQARVYRGGARMDAIPDTWISSREVSERFGCSVAGGGDIDGDGYDDYCVGAYGNDVHGVDAGRLYLYFNTLAGVDLPDLVLTGRAGEKLGWAAKGIGDVNGDSFGDFAVAVMESDRYSPNGHAVFVYYGGAVLDTIPDAILTQPASVEGFGATLSDGGDLNGDGLDDLVIGAPGGDGQVFVYLSRPGFIDAPDRVFAPGDTAAEFGFALSCRGDFNGDGYDDLYIGAPGYSDGAGAVFWLHGGPVVGTVLTMWGPGTAGSRYGHSMAMLDINEDGYSDLVVGRPTYPSLPNIYVSYGHPTTAGGSFRAVFDSSGGAKFGDVIASAGDVNGDGFEDLLVSGRASSPSSDYRVWLFLGGSAWDVFPDLVFRDPSESIVGLSISGPADVNGDGFDDVVIQSRHGAYVYFGGREMDDVLDISLENDFSLSFGGSVSAAGDLNGDGATDLIFGAPEVPFINDAGIALLYVSSPPAIVPRIFSAADVPADQGGRVLLSWTRSGYDALGISRVTSYIVERSLPPGKTGFAWEPIGSIQAGHNPRYAFAAPTLNDSSSNASGTLFFRVTAATNNPNEYWRSMAVSAHSVDNLAPPAPGPLGGSMTGETALLHWRPSTAEDLFGYELFRSTSPGFDPDTLLPIATLADTAFADTAFPAAPTLHYAVRAIDVHGNRSGPSNELSLGAVGIAEDGSPLPATFVLEQNYPNPFNPTTIFRYGVPERAEVSLILYNMLGEEIAVLVRDVVEAGYHEVRLNAAHLPTGMYFCIMKGGGVKSTRKVALIR